MKKLLHILCVVLVISFCLAMAGCNKESSVPGYGSAVADAMSSEGKKNYKFYVMKAGDRHMTIIDDCVDVYDFEDCVSEDLEDGQIALVKADVTIVTGGFAGYCNDIFVKKVKSVKVLDYEDVVKKVKIPEAGSDEFSYYKRFFKYENEDGIYFVFLDRQYIDVYLNGEKYMQYEFDGLEDDLAPFYESLEK